MNLEIRHANLSLEYPDIARIISSVNPGWPVTAETLHEDDERSDPNLHRLRFVAQLLEFGLEGSVKRIVGTGMVRHDIWAHDPSKYIVDLRIDPEFINRGIGSGLLQTFEDHLLARGAKLLQVHIEQDKTRDLRFAMTRGFTEAWRRIESRLLPSETDFSKFTQLEDQLEMLGLQIQSYAELEHDLTREQQLYDLDWQVSQDVPFGETPTQPSLEQWRKECVDNPKFDPHACFIVTRDSGFIGFTYLMGHAGGFSYIGMTGVIRELRGKHLATLLKLRCIQYARDHGNSEIRTFNDGVNAAMLRMNANLGFKQQPATIRFEKRFDST